MDNDIFARTRQVVLVQEDGLRRCMARLAELRTLLACCRGKGCNPFLLDLDIEKGRLFALRGGVLTARVRLKLAMSEAGFSRAWEAATVDCPEVRRTVAHALGEVQGEEGTFVPGGAGSDHRPGDGSCADTATIPGLPADGLSAGGAGL